METSSPRLAYVFVFECEMCKREVYAYYHVDKPELDFRKGHIDSQGRQSRAHNLL